MRVLALLALLVPCVACDQVAKALAVTHLKGASTIHVVDGFFRLLYAENPGAFLGLGNALPGAVRMTLFVGATALVLGGVAYVVVRRRPPPLAALGMALLVAGGVGNLIDRVSRPGGRVVDFAQLQVGPLQTGVFNVADVHIMVGAGLLLVSSLRKRNQEEPPAATA